jgi:branched-chain amino acid transport system substrate-binding protein
VEAVDPAELLERRTDVAVDVVLDGDVRDDAEGLFLSCRQAVRTPAARRRGATNSLKDRVHAGALALDPYARLMPTRRSSAGPRLRRAGVASLAVLGLAVAAGSNVAPAFGAATALPAAACSAVEYGGTGAPDAIIATDFPLQGASATRSAQMVAGVRLTLQRRGWAAGSTTIGLQSCDDADAATGAWVPALCDRNATAYAANSSVLGVVGTYNSGCAQRIVPILNQAGVAMISPGNTLVCLTQKAASCGSYEPGMYSPAGKLTYARVVPNDAYQGAALATFAVKNLKAKRIAVLSGGDTTSNGQAAAVSGAARKLGAKIVLSKTWKPKAATYTTLMRSVKHARPDAILLAGLTEQHGGRVIKDKVAVLGKNSGRVKLLALDGFAQTSTIDLAGKAAAGMYTSTPGSAPELLTSTLGKQVVASLKGLFPGQPVEPFAPYSAQAADVLLNSIAAKGTDRAAIAASLFGATVTDGIIGTFSLTAAGDPAPGRVTLSIAKGAAFSPLRLVAPTTSTVNAARGTS